MVLATHAAAGTLAAILFRRHPVLAIIAALASHFALDALPHWRYPLASYHRDPEAQGRDFIAFDRSLVTDLIRTGFDCSLGLLLSVIMTSNAAPTTMYIGLAGAALGVLPDLLQLVYYRFPDSPIRYLQRFHRWVHAKIDLVGTRSPLGIGVEVAVIALCVTAARYFVQ
jgi:hypothetical protein